MELASVHIPGKLLNADVVMIPAVDRLSRNTTEAANQPKQVPSAQHFADRKPEGIYTDRAVN
jgi:DNA invertase Pin-like site-specific DNA recombinase